MRLDKGELALQNVDKPPDGTTIELELPIGDVNLFRHSASKKILNFLALHPDVEVSTRKLSELIEFSEKATRSAVNVLEKTNLISTRREGNRRLVSIERNSLSRPDNPIDQIKQTEFRLPVKIALNEIQNRLDNVQGVILFGSVARGEANVKSDIDLWVLVGEERQKQLHKANKISKELNGIQIPPMIAYDYVSTEDDDFSQIDEYLDVIQDQEINLSSVPAPEYEILVETPESVLNKKENISTQMFKEGIVLFESRTLNELIEELISK